MTTSMPTMPRSIFYDVSHFVSRIGDKWHSGIDNVDIAYARHFAGRGDAAFVHFARPRPHVVSRSVAQEIVRLSSDVHSRAADTGSSVAYSRIREALTGELVDRPQRQAAVAEVRRLRIWLAARIQRLRMFVPSACDAIPKASIYLNAAPHLLERRKLFKWLHGRPDVTPVFLLHDLLPLDYPEFWQPSEVKAFPRRFETAFIHGRAFIVTSEAVKLRVIDELSRRGLKHLPIFVAPLPSPLGEMNANDLSDPALATSTYFVTVGTIEPRKNHLLLLAIWRQFAEAAERRGASIPKLVIVGGRGWENEQVLDVLDRGRLTRPYVIEASCLAPSELARLIVNARALLMPSFAEGYGFPLVEALSLGTPVVATDAPVFREVTQNCAVYRDAIDGVGWRDIIGRLADPGSAESRAARDSAARFTKPSWPRYFDDLERFLAALSESVEPYGAVPSRQF